MAYKIIDGYAYPSHSSAIGVAVVVFSLLGLLTVLFFTGVWGANLIDLL